jgi:hypothetical protein
MPPAPYRPLAPKGRQRPRLWWLQEMPPRQGACSQICLGNAAGQALATTDSSTPFHTTATAVTPVLATELVTSVRARARVCHITQTHRHTDTQTHTDTACSMNSQGKTPFRLAEGLLTAQRDRRGKDWSNNKVVTTDQCLEHGLAT